MKAQELMLGDWVYGLYPNGERYEVPFRISAIDTYPSNRSPRIVTFGGYGFQEEHLEPIPITPEILEKNWFVFLYSSVPGGTPQEQRMRKVDTYKWQGIAVNYYHETNDLQMVNFRGVRLNYVHQLQHALRLVGIEKEIVL